MRLFIFLLIAQFIACTGLNTTSEIEILDNVSDQIHLNQIGYYPKAIKKAIVVLPNIAAEASLINATTNKLVQKFPITGNYDWPLAGDRAQVIDFTTIEKPGTYFFNIPEMGRSHTFEIGAHILSDAFYGAIKGLYYQRASMALDERYAGQWHRKAGHPDTNIKFHASTGRSGEAQPAPGGWYDAGDFNKYIVNACFPLGYEQYPLLVQDAALNIPESGNGISDYIDELKYGNDWTLSMQDQDGGLFHKLTAKRFEGIMMPHEAKSQRYLVGKGTAATLDFAAANAQAFRIYQSVDKSYAMKCLSAAQLAWNYALSHPKDSFSNPTDISTGEYGDSNFEDEWKWAAAELYVSTGEKGYLNYLKKNMPLPRYKGGEGWRSYMNNLAVFTLLNSKQELPEEWKPKLKKALMAVADTLLEKIDTNDYFQPIDRFVWGSSSDVMNAAMIMAQTYRLTNEVKYLYGVQESVDYIFGKNPLGISFLTGFGKVSPKNIHHRQTNADRIEAAVPGLLSGGPNFMQQDTTDGTIYPKNVAPMKSWVDQESSYASNEICLNWNAPLIYVLGFLEAESK